MKQVFKSCRENETEGGRDRERGRERQRKREREGERETVKGRKLLLFV